MKEKAHITYDFQSEPIFIFPSVVKKMMDSGNYADVLALWTFLYYHAKRKKTTTIKAVTKYIANKEKGLGWDPRRISKAKKILINLGLIKQFQNENGWFIQVNFIWSTEKTRDLMNESENLDNTDMQKCTSEENKTGTYANTHMCKNAHVQNCTSNINSINNNKKESKIRGRDNQPTDEPENLKESNYNPSTIPPNINDVKRFFDDHNYTSNYRKFFNHFDSIGWERRKGQMFKKWVPLAENWELSERPKTESDIKKDSRDMKTEFNRLKKDAI